MFALKRQHRVPSAAAAAFFDRATALSPWSSYASIRPNIFGVAAMSVAIRSKMPSFIVATIASHLVAGTIAVSVAGVVVLASFGPAHAGKFGGADVAAASASPGSHATGVLSGSSRNAAQPSKRATGKPGTAGSIHCEGPGCPDDRQKINRANVVGKAVNGDPRPEVRDHRDGAGRSGGVIVSEGKPRPKGPICAGWGC
jgi:hypothetical protein